MSRAREVGDLGSVVTVDDGNLIINESGADVDFRVEGDTDANLLFVDASADKVGIGASDPVGKIDCRGILTISNSVSSYWGFDRDDSTGDLTLSNSNTTPVLSFTESGAYLRLASGSGGIQFNGDTAAANALDDYEEGFYTPTFTPDTGSVTVSTSWSKLAYVKIGRVVHIYGEIRFTSASSPTGIMKMSIPFAAMPDGTGAGEANFLGRGAGVIAPFSFGTINSPVLLKTSGNLSTVDITYVSSGTCTPGASQFSGNEELSMFLTYFTT